MEFSESEEESQIETNYEAYEDRDTIKRGRQALGITREYVPDWTSRDAFREFFQNWVDGMIEAHNVTRESIKIDTRDSDIQWVATAHRPGSTELIGFIRFMKKKGALELSNFKAQLTRKALDLGVSSKRNVNNMAGTHGEGLKVAALVMVRKGYQVRYESAKYYWSFQFGGPDKRHLYCQLTPMKDSVVTKQMLANTTRLAAFKPRELVSNIWEDVSVKIGKVYGVKGNEIETSTFMDWIKVSFEINRPSNCVKTSNGELVLDKTFGGRIYLKGLYIGDSASTKYLKFGYNLSSGKVNRDRQRLTDGGKEATTLAQIWADAILKGNEEALKEYTKMLLEDDFKQWADVNLAKEKITMPVAKKVWKCLLDVYPEKDIFFYNPQKQADEDVRVIKYDLKMLPVSLPTSIWEPLRACGLVRTPEEHCYHLLHHAPASTLEETPYSAGVKRALSCALALNEKTDNLKVVFKANSKANLNLLLVGSELLINDKWLDFERSHEHVSCFLWGYEVEAPEFPCDHVIIRLYELILSELEKGPKTMQRNTTQSTFSMRMKLDESLRQMPRMIQLEPGTSAGELKVSWMILESDAVYKLFGVELMFRVILHCDSTCSDRRADLLFQSETGNINKWEFEEQDGQAECGCCFAIVSQRKNSTIFANLDCEQTYFPMISRNCDQAFFGVPSESFNAIGHIDSDSKSKDDSDDDSENGSRKSVADAPESGSKGDYKENSEDDSTDEDDDAPVPMVHSKSIIDEGNEMRGTPNPLLSTNSEQLDPNMEELKTQTEQLNSTLRTQKRELQAADQNLRIKDQELASTTDALESKEIELRQAKAESEAEIQRLSSIIEDLQGENQQLQETGAEHEAQVADLSSTVENLRTEVQQQRQVQTGIEGQHEQLADESQRLCAANSEIESPNRKSADPRKQFQHAQQIKQENEGVEALRNEVRGLKRSNESFQTGLKQAQEDRKSMVGTLKSVSDMIQGVLNLKTREHMVPLLQGVLGMIQGMVTLGTRASSTEQQVAGVKRERQNDDEAAPKPSARPSKRPRTAATIINQEYIFDLTD